MAIKKILFVISTVLVTFASFHAQSQTINNAGLKRTVSVRRDSRSIPYIDAKNDADLYFVQGYVTASDRLWQMDLLRRVARGQTAELFGSATLEEDKRWRRYGFAAIVEEGVTHLSPELRAALDSYARGVNAYIATLDEKSLPVEFKILQYKPSEWKSTDSVIIGKILADALSSTWRNDLLRATFQNLPKDKLADLTNQVTPYDVVLFGKDSPNAERGMRNAESLAEIDWHRLLRSAEAHERIRETSLSRVGMYAEDLAASNNWVISGKRTADGKPLLANDPHLLPSAPGIWYLTHLSTPAMRVSGVTFPGVPGIVLGHNENIAWGATNVGPDVQDLVVETFEADGKYKTPAGSIAPIMRREEIKVRKSLVKPETETVALDVIQTRNGPIVMEEGGKKYALKWTALDPKNSEFEAFFLMNRAKDWSGFKNALRVYGGAMQNFVYADVKGNIGWYAAGRIPIRKVGDGALPYDGSTDDGAWIGNIPFDELPNLYNPPEGFIVTANQRIVGTGYKYASLLSRDAAPPWRARRIYDLLKANTKVTMDDVAAIQMDAQNIPLRKLAEEQLQQMTERKLAEEQLQQRTDASSTLDALKGWDGVMKPESKAALVANELRLCLASAMAKVTPGVPVGIVATRILDYKAYAKNPSWIPAPHSSYASLVAACDKELPAILKRKYGTDPAGWTWAAVSKSRFPHPLAVAPLIGGQFATPSVPISGSGQTPNVASFVSMRHIASPGNWDTTRHVIPLGQSGNPQSPHYKDQFQFWSTGSAAIFPFSKQAVEAGTRVELTFQPAR